MKLKILVKDLKPTLSSNYHCSIVFSSAITYLGMHYTLSKEHYQTEEEKNQPNINHN